MRARSSAVTPNQLSLLRPSQASLNLLQQCVMPRATLMGEQGARGFAKKNDPEPEAEAETEAAPVKRKRGRPSKADKLKMLE